MSLRKQGLMNFQIQLTRPPGRRSMMRDYVAREEARLRALERGSKPKLKLAGQQ
jgi:cyclopropane-fatty-acyl-phospholipid synthase